MKEHAGVSKLKKHKTHNNLMIFISVRSLRQEQEQEQDKNWQQTQVTSLYEPIDHLISVLIKQFL